MISTPSIGTGWLGGMMPAAAFAMIAWRGDIYFGLWYTVVIILISVAVGALYLRETKDVDIHA